MELSFVIAAILVIGGFWAGLATGIWVGRWAKVGVLVSRLLGDDH